MSILPPELDANYELIEEMGKGGMGAVYKARHRHLDEPCVIKVMHPQLDRVSGARDRFFREAKRGKQLRHPNIAEVLAFFVGTDGKAYLVMEYVDGQNLRELLSLHGVFDAKLVVAIGVEALSALACLHERQIVHRDISPDNLMLAKNTAAPRVKLIDLGIAKALDETMSLTGTGMFVGKMHYASPEQFGGKVDVRSDLYSLGVVLYELATGARPVDGDDTMALIAATMNDPPRPFAETDRGERVPAALRAVILKALEKNPDHRFQTATDFAQALQRALASDSTTVVDVTPATEPMTARVSAPVPAPARTAAGRPPVRRFTLAWIASGGALLVLIGMLTVVMMLRGTDETSKGPAVTASAAPAGTSVTVTAADTATTTREPLAVQETVTPERRQSAARAITRGKQLAGNHKMADAYASFREATEANPNDAFAWANLGGAAAVLGKEREARTAYERALAIEPANWLAHYNFACLLTGSGARDEAMDHLETAVAQLRLQARSRDELAAVMRSVRTDEALRALHNDSAFTKLLAVD